MKVESSRVCILLVAQALFIAAFVSLPALAKAVVQGDISRIADTAHIEFTGMKSWNYELQRNGKKKVVLSMPPFDSATEAKLKGFADPFISSISIDKAGPDGTYQVTFELANESVESFDYLTDDPSRLIIDFYKKVPEAQPVAKANPAAPSHLAKLARHGKKDTNKEPEMSQGKREPAGDEFLQVDQNDANPSPLEVRSGAYDAADAGFDRFRVKDYEIREDAILASAHNIYLPFPMLKMPVSRLDAMIKNPPEYVIHPKGDDENKMARLLLALFERGRFNMFLKTFEHFSKKYPESNYLEILENLKATGHLQNWKNTGDQNEFEMARDAYVDLIKKYPDSPLLERNNLILGYMQLEHGEALTTLQHFAAFIEKFPKSPEIPQVRKGIAEAFLLIHKYDDGLKVYGDIAKDYSHTPDGPEARYRMGDVEFARENWPAAVESYRKVIKELPQLSSTFPNAHFNLAEALFWKKDYKASLDEFINFLNLFPADRYGGYAMTRIGEIMGILGVDPRRSMGAFLESSFRYPENPGAKVARLRMLTTQMRGMRPKDLKKALTEIKASINEVKLPGMEEFSTLLLAEGLESRGAYTDSLKLLIDYFQGHPQLKNKDQLTAGILRDIASEIKTDLDREKFLDALQFEAKYDKTWLLGKPRMDIPYFEGRAFEQAGAWTEAEKIYKNVSAQLDKIAGTQEEKERRVSEYLPKRSTLQLRLAKVAVEKRNFGEAYNDLKHLSKADDLSEDEQIEKVQLQAAVSEFRGDWDRAKAALHDLVQRWKGDQAKLDPVFVHLGELDLRTNSYETAQNNADKALNDKNLSEDLRAKALEVKGDSLLGQKRTMAAIEVYQDLLEQYESKRPMGSVRYKVGQLLFEHGDIKGAEEVWGKLQGGANEIYWDLAKERLNHAKWRNEFQRYVQRIPAMTGPSQKEENSQ